MKNHKTLLAFFPVFLTIVSAQNIDFINAAWAGISSYMVFLERLDKTIEKGIFRMLGTLLGASFALGIVKIFSPNTFQVAILVLIITTFGIYFNNTTNHGYAWIYFSLVFFIVLAHSISNFIGNLEIYALHRILSVIYGSTITIIFKIFYESKLEAKKILNNLKSKESIKNYFFNGYKKNVNIDLLFYALSGAISLCFIIFIGKYLYLNIFFQAGTSVLFILNIPFSNISSKGLNEIYKKGLNRVLGALTGTVLGLISFLLIKINYGLYNVLIAIIILLCLFIKNYEKYAYYSTQIFAGFCFVMLPKPLINESYTAIFSRAIGVIVAIIIIYFSFFINKNIHKIYNKLKKSL